jgi:hypothetical protein
MHTKKTEPGFVGYLLTCDGVRGFFFCCRLCCDLLGARAGAEGAERGSGGQCLWVTAGAASAA